MIVPIIIVIAIIAVIGVFIYMNMTGKGIIGTKDVETLIPVRSESGNTNILVVGNDTSKKDQIYMTITGLTADELSTCPEGKDRLKYNLQEKELEVNGTKYDFYY